MLPAPPAPVTHSANVPHFAAPTYLRLTRKGTAYTAECGTDGTTWRTIGTVTVDNAAATEDAGVFMTAANGWSGARGIAEFHGLTVTTK